MTHLENWHRDLLATDDREPSGLPRVIEIAREMPAGEVPGQHIDLRPEELLPEEQRRTACSIPEPTRILTKRTRVGSAGGGVAVDLSNRLQREGFNYLVKETNHDGANGLHSESANWGKVSSIPCFLQLIERSFGQRSMPAWVWPDSASGKAPWGDPWRPGVSYSSLSNYQSAWELHLRASRQVLEEAEVFIVSFSRNNVRELITNGSVFGDDAPPIAPGLCRLRIPTVEENVRDLQKMWDLWRRYNPTIILILAVSPASSPPSGKASRDLLHTQECCTKANLRLAIEQFVSGNRDAHYFPAFETAIYESGGRWDPSTGALSGTVLDKCLALFEGMFLGEEPQSAGRRLPAPIHETGCVVQDRHPTIVREEFEVHRLLEGALATGGPLGSTRLDQLLLKYCSDLETWASTGRLEPALYEAQRELYKVTQGEFANLMLRLRQQVYPAQVKPGRADGVLGAMGAQEVERCVQALERDGCLVFPNALPSSTCAQLVQFAREAPSRAILGAGQYGAPEAFGETGSDCTRHSLLDGVALSNSTVLQLTVDESVIAIVRGYLKCEPTISHSRLIWSRAVNQEPDGMAAQLFHYDLNHLNFLKVFVYLTDVDKATGPHSFVMGSHRAKPPGVFLDGRRSDDEIRQHFEPEKIRDITGSAGTLILADTRAFHRGKRLIRGERLILNMAYTDGMVGAPMEPVVIPSVTWAREHKARNPRLWQKYTFSD